MSVSLSVRSDFFFFKGMPFKLYIYFGAFVTYFDPIVVSLLLRDYIRTVYAQFLTYASHALSRYHAAGAVLAGAEL